MQFLVQLSRICPCPCQNQFNQSWLPSPAQVSVPVAELNKLMEMVKLVQMSKGASPSTPKESDAESLPSVSAHTPSNVTVNATPKRSVSSLQGTRLQFSETSTSNAD